MLLPLELIGGGLSCEKGEWRVFDRLEISLYVGVPN